jgi:hypothetical protein
MSTAVRVTVRAHAVTYVTYKLLTSLKTIIRESGLDPAHLTNQWAVLERGITRWLDTEDLEELHLEVFHPHIDALIGRWDFEICYEYTGDGAFSADSDAIYYHLRKAGVWPDDCAYRIVATTKPGRPDVEGWSSTTLRSTAGFVRQSIGTAIDGSGVRASGSYWRKVS